MTIEDAIQLGADTARKHIELVEAAHGSAVAAAYAGGIASGARNWVAGNVGVRAAFELCAGMAAQCAERVQ